MKYWEQETSVLVQPEMAAADSTSIGVWMRILNYCAIQENGGRITNAATTLRSERALSATLGITRDELEHALEHSTIVFLDGTDLCILNYCHREQSTLEARRTGGKSGGRPRSETSRKPPENLPAQEVFSPETSPSRVREGKEREGKVRDSSAQGAGSPLSDSEFLTAAEKGNEAAAIARSYPANGSESRAIAAIVRLLASGTVTPDDLRAKVALHASRWHALPARLQGFCPGRVAYFEDSRWNDDPNLAPWIDPDVSQTEVPAPKKNKSAAQQETEARRMAIAREMWPELAEFLPWEALSPEQRLRVQQEDQRREAERRAAA